MWYIILIIILLMIITWLICKLIYCNGKIIYMEKNIDSIVDGMVLAKLNLQNASIINQISDYEKQNEIKKEIKKEIKEVHYIQYRDREPPIEYGM